MEKLEFKFNNKENIKKFVHVGVVASGDLEILVYPNEMESRVKIVTGSDGFKEIWMNVLTRFFERYSLQGTFIIHDFGATPGVVNLRLTQLMEVLKDEQ
ncbi:malonate decarboxylase acyl carrier protein [Liquorilactobacillus hordei]|uniref:malonate decarboxylase acyl carrier protein n=1 Tax=Liquorilactobacillus hordei TaxID=468911 RepID=UPI0039EB9D74